MKFNILHIFMGSPRDLQKWLAQNKWFSFKFIFIPLGSLNNINIFLKYIFYSKNT